jgi:hypothetical protein
MPEDNGFATGDARVDAALKRMQERNDARFKALEDAMLVQVHLEKRMGEIARQHTEWLASHESGLKDLRERDRIIDDRINKLVSSIGELIRRIPPENLR